MKTNQIFMAVVALFISLTVMTAQVPAKKDAKAEPAKKECTDQAKKECKDAKTADCTAKAECKDAARTADCSAKTECKDAAKAGECKDKKAATAQNQACCDKKDTAQK